MKTEEISSVQEAKVCSGEVATLIASGASDEGWYQWYEDIDDTEAIAGVSSAQFVTPILSKSKTYYVAAANASGCESNRVPVVASVSLMDEVVLSIDGTTLYSNYETGNQWFLNGSIIAGETSDRIEALEPGVYSLQVTDGDCSSSASREMTITSSEESLIGQPTITLFPNPTRDKVIVRVNSFNSNTKAVILNSTGAQIEATTLVGENGVKEGEFNLLPYATGIYNIKIFDGSKVFIKKIAKVK